MNTSLNKRQREFVNAASGPVVVSAGPGTGKTFSLTQRAINLHKVGCTNLLILTFTKKSAKEIENRLDGAHTYVHTFHSFAYSKLQQDGEVIEIAPSDIRVNIISDLSKKYQTIAMDSSELASRITLFKNSFHHDTDGGLSRVVQEYNERLMGLGYCDFDDILHKYLHRQTKGEVEEAFGGVLVDEFQDTNMIQYQILRNLKIAEDNINVIGDPLQSIYRFRGSVPSIFEQFCLDYPNSLNIHLVENYRSTPAILQIAHTLFPETPELTTTLENETTPTFIETEDRHSEAECIVRKIESAIGGTDLIAASENRSGSEVSFSDFAVIARTHSQLFFVEKAFKRRGIPYQMIGGESLFTLPDVRFVISLLCFLGGKTVSTDALDGVTTEELYDYLQVVGALGDMSIEEVYQITREKFSEHLGKGEHLVELWGRLMAFSEYPDGLERFLGYYDEISNDNFFDKRANLVTLGTIHSVKGLEFDYVFILGFYDGGIPYTRKEENTESLAEERRLLYVAITRAKRRIYFLYPRGSGNRSKKPSRFFGELSDGGVVMVKDSMAEKIRVRRRKAKLKKAQLKMF